MIMRSVYNYCFQKMNVLRRECLGLDVTQFDRWRIGTMLYLFVFAVALALELTEHT